MRKLFTLLLALLLVTPTNATLVSIGGTISWPAPTPFLAATNMAFSQTLLDLTGEMTSGIGQIPVTGTITKIGFATGTVTVGNSMTCRLETVDATTGDPTGTAYGGMTQGTVAIADGDDNVWKLCTLAVGASAVQGDLVAVVIGFDTWVAGNLNIQRIANTTLAVMGTSYSDLFTAGAWGKSSGWPAMTLDYGGTYYPVAGFFPTYTLTAATYNSGASNDEGGNIITLPFKCRVAGVWFYGGVVGGLTAKLYDTDGSTVLASTVVDKDQQTATTNGYHVVRFTSGITLNAAGAYRATILAAGASSEVMYNIDVDTAAAMGAHLGGSNIHFTTRDGGGSWTQTTTRRAMMGLLIDQVDDGASAGGTRRY